MSPVVLKREAFHYLNTGFDLCVFGVFLKGNPVLGRAFDQATADIKESASSF
jgi:hypothetical protein